MFIHQCTFIESVSYLLGIKGLDTYKREPVEEKEIEFSLPERSDSFRHIYAYLIKTRKIDRWVVDQFIKEKCYMKINTIVAYLLDTIMMEIQDMRQSGEP